MKTATFLSMGSVWQYFDEHRHFCHWFVTERRSTVNALSRPPGVAVMISWYARELLARDREREIVGNAERRRVLSHEKPLSLEAPSIELTGVRAAATRRSWFARLVRAPKHTT
jgi:hypothetical protein